MSTTSTTQKSTDIEQGLASDKQIKEEKMVNAIAEKNALEGESLWSKVFFSWVSPVLDKAKKSQMNVNELGNVRSSDDVKSQQARLYKCW